MYRILSLIHKGILTTPCPLFLTTLPLLHTLEVKQSLGMPHNFCTTGSLRMLQHTASSYLSLSLSLIFVSFFLCRCLCSVSTNYHSEQQDLYELQINQPFDADDVCMDQNTFTVHWKEGQTKCIRIDADAW